MIRFLDKLRLVPTDLLALLVLLVAGAKFTFGIQQVLDVALYDESNYLYAGVTLVQHGLPAPAFAPLYALWYYLLALLQPDRINLYYLNYVLTTVSPPVLLYLLLRVNRVSVLVSTLAAAYLLISHVNFSTWPRVSHLALIILLGCGILASYAQHANSAGAWLAFGALLASFVRPEFFLSSVLLFTFALSLSVARYRRAPSLAAFVPVGSVFACGVILLYIFGLPMFGKDASYRQFEAFSQHFAVNWVQWSHLDPVAYNPWTNSQEIVAKQFDHANSITGALLHNPPLFLHHVLSNLKSACVRFLALSFKHENIFLPEGERAETVEAGIFLLLLLSLAFFYARPSPWWLRIRANFRHRISMVIFLALLCSPAMISVVALAPREHYLLIPMASCLFLVVVLVYAREEVGESVVSLPYFAFLMVLLLAVMPMVWHRHTRETPIVKVARHLRALKISAPVTEFDGKGGFYVYQSDNYHYVPEYDSHGSFDQLMADHHINLIVYDDELRKDNHLRDDPAWNRFIEHYEDQGFVAQKVPEAGTTLLIKNDLLPRQP